MKAHNHISEQELSFLKDYYQSQYDKDNHSRFIDLILKYEHDKEFQQELQTIMNEESGDVESDELNVEYQLNKLHHSINLKSRSDKSTGRKIFIRNFQRIAAILILPLMIAALAAGYFISQVNTYGTGQAIVEISASSGSKTNFTLPDGTKGWLNSNSSLSYPQGFKGGRKVTLIGEAYFDVVHNKKDPFYVEADNLNVKVLGTKFDVINYPNENQIEVILEEGKVECSVVGNENKHALSPNQLLSIDKSSSKISISDVKANHYTSWKDGLLILRDGALSELLTKLSRWHDIEIEVVDDKLLGYTFWGVFWNEEPETILDLLKITSPIKYEVIPRKLLDDDTFSKKKI
ncbi:MAG: FecR domain-containing protein, partial [Draconibacterium sp.]|nr:FecR domain-containing protein [Draconibacterium sp.]